MAGLFTDGDLRRTLEKHDDIRSLRVADVMTRGPRTIGPGRLAAEAAQVMQAHRVSGRLLVVDDDGRLVGALHVDDDLVHVPAGATVSVRVQAAAVQMLVPPGVSSALAARP